MSEPSLFDQQSLDPSLSSVVQLRRRFAAAWDDALAQGSAPPELEKYLDGLPEPKRSQARPELEALDQSYRQRLGSGSSEPAATLPGETVPEPLRREQETIDYASPPKTPDPKALLPQPAATVHGGPDGTGENGSAAGAFSVHEHAAENAPPRIMLRQTRRARSLIAGPRPRATARPACRRWWPVTKSSACWAAEGWAWSTRPANRY